MVIHTQPISEHYSLIHFHPIPLFSITNPFQGITYEEILEEMNSFPLKIDETTEQYVPLWVLGSSEF